MSVRVFSPSPLSCGLCLLGLVVLSGCAEDPRPQDAENLVNRVADELDAKTDEVGSYIRSDRDRPEVDPWGQTIRAEYTSGGVSELLIVRSAGADREWNTEDDVLARRQVMNFKGVGQGIKGNAGSVSKEITKGLIEGTAEGAKEVAKKGVDATKKFAGRLTGKFKKNDDEEEAPEPESSPDENE